MEFDLLLGWLAYWDSFIDKCLTEQNAANLMVLASYFCLETLERVIEQGIERLESRRRERVERHAEHKISKCYRHLHCQFGVEVIGWKAIMPSFDEDGRPRHDYASGSPLLLRQTNHGAAQLSGLSPQVRGLSSEATTTRIEMYEHGQSMMTVQKQNWVSETWGREKGSSRGHSFQSDENSKKALITN